MLAIGCVLAVLAAATLAPAYAGAQAAKDEYKLDVAPAKNTPGNGPPASSSDGGSSAPIVLIGLAGVAAVCAGVAVWRLRDRPGGPTGKVGPGAPEAAGETQ